jgi:hypothetical protein
MKQIIASLILVFGLFLVMASGNKAQSANSGTCFLTFTPGTSGALGCVDTGSIPQISTAVPCTPTANTVSLMAPISATTCLPVQVFVGAGVVAFNGQPVKPGMFAYGGRVGIQDVNQYPNGGVILVDQQGQSQLLPASMWPAAQTPAQ